MPYSKSRRVLFMKDLTVTVSHPRCRTAFIRVLQAKGAACLEPDLLSSPASQFQAGRRFGSALLD